MTRITLKTAVENITEANQGNEDPDLIGLGQLVNKKSLEGEKYRAE